MFMTFTHFPWIPWTWWMEFVYPMHEISCEFHELWHPQCMDARRVWDGAEWGGSWEGNGMSLAVVLGCWVEPEAWILSENLSIRPVCRNYTGVYVSIPGVRNICKYTVILYTSRLTFFWILGLSKNLHLVGATLESSSQNKYAGLL
jgi:hypothetical protein